MILKSINKAEVRTVNWRLKKVKTGIYKRPVPEGIITENNLAEDHVVDRKYHGGKDMQLYAYSFNHYAFWKLKYPKLDFDFGMFGENLTIDGLDEAEVCIGDEWKVGEEVGVRVTQPRQPCFKLGIKFESQKIIKDFIAAPYPGLYFTILNPGALKRNDKIELTKRNSELKILEVWNAIYNLKTDKRRLLEMIDNPYLSEDVKVKFRKRI